MKKVTLALFCFLLSAGLMAQKIYFIYIQTDNQQPFFVRMNEKISDIIQPDVKIEVPLTSNTDEKKTETLRTEPEQEKKQTAVIKEMPYKKSDVIKIAQNNVADGIEIAYADKQTEKTDTITI